MDIYISLYMKTFLKTGVYTFEIYEITLCRYHKVTKGGLRYGDKLVHTGAISELLQSSVSKRG